MKSGRGEDATNLDSVGSDWCRGDGDRWRRMGECTRLRPFLSVSLEWRRFLARTIGLPLLNSLSRTTNDSSRSPATSPQTDRPTIPVARSAPLPSPTRLQSFRRFVRVDGYRLPKGHIEDYGAELEHAAKSFRNVVARRWCGGGGGFLVCWVGRFLPALITAASSGITDGEHVRAAMCDVQCAAKSLYRCGEWRLSGRVCWRDAKGGGRDKEGLCRSDEQYISSLVLR